MSDTIQPPPAQPPPAQPPPAIEERARACVELLEALADDRGRLADLPAELHRRLLIAAGRITHPQRAEQRRLAKAFRRKDRNAKRAADEAARASTGIRRLRQVPVFPSPEPEIESEPLSASASTLLDARKCYVCKAEFTEIHGFYDQMCPDCADLNWRKRHQVADLSGRVALVTGARVKIGYQAALKLLRAGAHVIATTRFPRDAAARYAAETDYEAWRGRLEIHGIDLRHTPSVEAFADRVAAQSTRLDFILNNACQTVRRPSGFYVHMMEAERAPLDPVARQLLADADAQIAVRSRALPLVFPDSASLSQVPLLDEDLTAGPQVFPVGHLDADRQQIDLRDKNSWRLRLDEVPSVELLEVHLVNAVAPFVLNARLRTLMARDYVRGRDSTPDKHIVNVSAMEGQFYRKFKTDKHPHTNMAKAALNMMTRTSAADYVESGIHMNSVDTGWITDEDPVEIAARKVEQHRFHPPLDIVDGAARICDPIFDGFTTGEHRWGQFIKDYRPVPW